MKKLSARGQKWLKVFHLCFACLWVGAGFSLTLMNWCKGASDGMQLYGIHDAMKFIDDFVIIPGALGVLLTGLLYSLMTNWGWFRHRWITVKWLICLYGVIFGTYPLGPWLNGTVPIARAEGLNALTHPTFMHNKTMLLVFGTFQVATLIFAVLISSLKPWRKKKEKQGHESG